MLYLDTSAFLKLYIHEAGSEIVQQKIASQDFPIPIWDLLHAEFINALRLKVFWKEISQTDAEAQIDLFHQRHKRGLYTSPHLDRANLFQQFLRLSAETPNFGCRTMDIFHVACALEFSATEFLTFDQRQAKLANHAGLKTPIQP